MAQYQHLPIYKATYDLLARVTQATAGFSKAYKYSLGDRLRDEVVDMVVFIFRASSSRKERVQLLWDFWPRQHLEAARPVGGIAAPGWLLRCSARQDQ